LYYLINALVLARKDCRYATNAQALILLLWIGFRVDPDTRKNVIRNRVQTSILAIGELRHLIKGAHPGIVWVPPRYCGIVKYVIVKL